MMSLNRILGKLSLTISVKEILRNGHFSSRHIHRTSPKFESSTSTGLQDVCTEGKKHKMDVACKVAIVNGGTSGIGLSAASQLLCAGARNVTITGLNLCEGKEAATFLNNNYGMGKAMFINCNVNCMSEFEDAFKATKDAYKRIDIVVNATGMCDGSEWEREVVTNVIGTIRGTLLAYRYVGKEGSGDGGVVVNIAGKHGLKPLPSAPTLAASHHAIVGLSRSFGDKLHKEKSGIRVVCLCPGWTQTNFIKHISKRGMTESLGKHLEKAVRKAVKQGPDPCGKAVLHLIRHGKNGSVWICEGSRLFTLHIPDTKVNSTLVAQYL